MSSFDTWPPIRIAGTGAYLPERVVTNDELVAAGLETTDEWILERTGIRERRYAAVGETTSTMAAGACMRALAAAGVHVDDVDLVVLATSTPEWQQPATATALHDALGMRADAGAVDIGAVCCGFVYALHAGASMLAGGEAWTCVLVVGAEHYSRLTDPADRATRVYFGDGAGAVVLRKELELADVAVLAAVEQGIDIGVTMLPGTDGGVLDDATPGLRSIVYGTHPGGRDALLTPHGAFLRMDGRAVREFAVPAMVEAVRSACRDAGATPGDLALLVPHQSNLRLLQAAIDELGLPEGRLATTVELFGNTAGASIPITLDAAARAGRLADGDLVCLVGYGSGLQSAASVLRWSD